LSPIPEVITDLENQTLMAPIQEKEVIEVIWSSGPDKAPGPDGFSIHFFQAFWHLIKRDMCLMLNSTKFKDKIGGGTNSSFLALIPKETKPSYFSRFMPISLCNFAYKILTKIIAIGIKKLLPIFISENQGGFL
jgi:hypothetical protein